MAMCPFFLIAALGAEGTGRLVALVLSVLWPYVGAVRVGRAGIFVDEEGVEIVNPIKRKVRARWGEIKGFSLERYAGFPFVGMMELKNGEKHHISGIYAPVPIISPYNTNGQELIAALNEELRQRTFQNT